MCSQVIFIPEDIQFVHLSHSQTHYFYLILRFTGYHGQKFLLFIQPFQVLILLQIEDQLKESIMKDSQWFFNLTSHLHWSPLKNFLHNLMLIFMINLISKQQYANCYYLCHYFSCSSQYYHILLRLLEPPKIVLKYHLHGSLHYRLDYEDDSIGNYFLQYLLLTHSSQKPPSFPWVETPKQPLNLQVTKPIHFLLRFYLRLWLVHWRLSQSLSGLLTLFLHILHFRHKRQRWLN